MKKIKWILLAITLALASLFLFATCRKTKALESELIHITANIRESDQGDYNIVFIFDLGENYLSNKSNFMFIGGAYRLAITNQAGNNTNQVTIEQIGSSYYESFTTNSRFLQVQIVEDNNDLCLLFYDLNYTMQYNQGNTPVINGVSRTLKTRFVFGQGVYSQWTGINGLQMSVTSGTFGTNTPNFLFNYSYISVFDTVQDINNWVDNQLSNYKFINYLLNQSYNYGYTDGNNDGYLDGFDDGEDRGYSDGYAAGELVGHAAGYEEGANVGYTHGFDEGYRDGWADGQAGETAITPAFNTLSGVFNVVSSVLSIELVPHVPIGLFFLVPLFFSAIGLILWIWRRN